MKTNVLVALCLYLFAVAAAAQELAPELQMTRMTTEVIEIIKQDQSGSAGHQKKFHDLVEAKMLPHFDFAHMTAFAMGRANWSKASEQQQKALTAEFRTLLVRAYTSALFIYRNQAVDFKPLRPPGGDARITVRTHIRQPGSESINIDYQMEKTPKGWMVYEVVVAGVSLVFNYREAFDAEVRDRGVDGLLKSLAGKNRSMDPQAGAKPN